MNDGALTDGQTLEILEGLTLGLHPLGYTYQDSPTLQLSVRKIQILLLFLWELETSFIAGAG